MMAPRDLAQLTKDVTETADAVVIGSGAGGAVVAKELAEGGKRVVILEEGAYHRSHKDLGFEAISRLYRDRGATTTLGSPIIPVPMGKCFGGTTVINSGTCFRTPEHVIRKWQEKHHLTELRHDTLDGAFDRVEREINVEDASFEVMSRPQTLIHELLLKEGFRGAPLKRNIRGCEGCGMCCYGCSTGAKQSMDVSYLPKALAAGALAYTHARASEILLDASGAAAGVIAEAVDRQGRRLGHKIEVRAKTVIIAAGTFITPQILKSNRIAHRNRHLGRHLTLHPATRVYGEFEEEIRPWEGTPQAYYLDIFKDEGIMFEGISTPPDISGMGAPLSGRKLMDFLKNYRHMASFGIMISDESEGRMIRLPFFGYTYLYSMTPGDVRRIQKAIAFLARVFLRGGAKRSHALVRGWHFESLEDVDRFERTQLRSGDIDSMAFHPLGTCRMSATPREGVCDQTHQVWGMPGLYVCDGSVIPTSLGVNPQVTIMAFATRLAFHLLGREIPKASHPESARTPAPSPAN